MPSGTWIYNDTGQGHTPGIIMWWQHVMFKIYLRLPGGVQEHIYTIIHSDFSNQRQIPRLDGHTFGMNSTYVHVLHDPDQPGFHGLLDGQQHFPWNEGPFWSLVWFPHTVSCTAIQCLFGTFWFVRVPLYLGDTCRVSW